MHRDVLTGRELLPEFVGDGSQLAFGEQVRFFRETVKDVADRCAARDVGREVQMEVWNVAAEDEDEHERGARDFLEGLRSLREDRSKRRALLPIQLGDERNVALRLQKRESRDFAVEARGEPPEVVLPDQDPLEFTVSLFAARR
jgi:hypothetical protein